MRIIYGILVLGFLSGCMNSTSSGQKYDGGELIEAKCSKCHNLDMPPKSYDNEIAPSMMAVTFHLKDFIKSNDPSSHEAKIVDFVKDYVINPSRDKSFCDKASLDSYGVMPSQKGNVTEDELEAIAHYMYATYDNQKLLKIMAEKQRLASLSLHERVFEQQRCNNCHDIHKDKVAPSFEMIASRYTQKDKATLIKSIKDGTKGKYKGKVLPMPSFKDKMSDKDIDGMVDWILSLKQ
ncbi:MAG: c-type cytochrome [Epsilonproteobacteria bacterium]|nr:c-type cytochrome [Campylobacterota bacterium]